MERWITEEGMFVKVEEVNLMERRWRWVTVEGNVGKRWYPFFNNIVLAGYFVIGNTAEPCFSFLKKLIFANELLI